jgi:chorismate mutase/prephenate dehydrogenase
MIPLALTSHIRPSGMIFPVGKRFNETDQGITSMSKKKISRIREKIDRIDQQILDLIKQRLQLSSQIGSIKRENQMSIIDPPREEFLFASLNKKSRELNLDQQFVSEIWRLILKQSYLKQDDRT